MIEAKFEYTHRFIKELNTSTMRTYNLIGQIALFLILCGAVIMFAVARNILLGVLASVTFVVLLVGFVCANKAVERSNRGLLEQQIKVNFGENEMTMTSSVGGQILYNAKFDYTTVKGVKLNNNLMYIKFDKNSVVVIPKSGFKTEADFIKALERVSNNYVM